MVVSSRHGDQRHWPAFNKTTVASIFVIVVFSCFNMFRFALTIKTVFLDTTPSEYEHEYETATQEQEEEGDQQREERFEPLSDVIEDNDEDDVIEDSFSACILWMDDNYRLEEWLAYHYYLLKLRYVVVNIDPFSKTSPNAIIDRWNDRENKYNLNMTIVTMKDSEYIEKYDLAMEHIEKARLSMSLGVEYQYQYGSAKTNYHRKRQPLFYKACSRHLIQQNKSWTSYHDTDEFLTFKSDKIDVTTNSSAKTEQPGYVLHKLNSIKNQLPLDTDVNETGLSCFAVDRRRYCANELSTEETNDLFSTTPSDSSTTGGIVPEGFMNSSIDSSTDEDRKTIVGLFDTLRYKYLTHGGDGMPKTFVDLSQRNPKLYAQNKWKPKVKNHSWRVHSVMVDLCKKESKERLSEIKSMVKEENFVINHYLGSFESYSFRDDARQGGLRTYGIWKKRANSTRGEFSDTIRPWLRGFVELVGGPNVASFLLQDAGKFPDDYDVVSRMKEYNTTYDFNKKPNPT